jgi:hypothetical protein
MTGERLGDEDRRRQWRPIVFVSLRFAVSTGIVRHWRCLSDLHPLVRIVGETLRLFAFALCLPFRLGFRFGLPTCLFRRRLPRRFFHFPPRLPLGLRLRFGLLTGLLRRRLSGRFEPPRFVSPALYLFCSLPTLLLFGQASGIFVGFGLCRQLFAPRFDCATHRECLAIGGRDAIRPFHRHLGGGEIVGVQRRLCLANSFVEQPAAPRTVDCGTERQGFG